MVRTTVAITQLRGSSGADVLATPATAHANIRIGLGETVQSTLDRPAAWSTTRRWSCGWCPATTRRRCPPVHALPPEPGGAGTLHAADERLSVAALRRGVAFHRNLISSL